MDHQIPHWDEILNIASRLYDLTGLGYLGVDIVLDKQLGPQLLEINARPGIAIQVANRRGLGTLLERVSRHIEDAKTVEERVRLGIGHPGSKDAVVYYVLNDFAKSERGWLSELLDAVSDAAPHLAKGDDARFLSDVAKTLYSDATPRRNTDTADDDNPRPAKKPTSASHPAGERASKRQSALAENLKKWLGARKSGDDGA